MDPSNALRFGQGSFPPNLVAIGHFQDIWPLVYPRWPLHDLWPQQCTTLCSGVLLTKFGSHRAFLRQIDPWMTFDPRLGRFENMPTNLVGLSPTPMPTFSSIRRSMTKHIAGHTYIHIHRLHYFSSIDIDRTINLIILCMLYTHFFLLHTHGQTASQGYAWIDTIPFFFFFFFLWLDAVAQKKNWGNTYVVKMVRFICHNY